MSDDRVKIVTEGDRMTVFNMRPEPRVIAKYIGQWDGRNYQFSTKDIAEAERIRNRENAKDAAK